MSTVKFEKIKDKLGTYFSSWTNTNKAIMPYQSSQHHKKPDQYYTVIENH